MFPSSPGLPLLAVGSPDRKAFYAQTYDPVHYFFHGTTRAVGLTVAPRGDDWLVRRTLYQAPARANAPDRAVGGVRRTS